MKRQGLLESPSLSGAAVVTPLIDLFANVLLLLLASNPVFGVKSVDLPTWQGNTQGRTTDKVWHNVEVTGAGKVLWDGRECSPEHLRAILKEVAQKGEKVLVRPEAKVPFEAVWGVYDLYNQAGFKDPLSVQVLPLEAAAAQHPTVERG